MIDPEKFKKVIVVLLLIVLAVAFIFVLILLGPRISTEPYSKFVLIGGSILLLVLGLLCTRMGRDGVTVGVMTILIAVFMLILGILV